MAVRSIRPDVAVESFVLEETLAKNGTQVKERWFVVNVWTDENADWHCTDSYVSRSTRPPGDHRPQAIGKE
jgi:hypothetical protein